MVATLLEPKASKPYRHSQQRHKSTKAAPYKLYLTENLHIYLDFGFKKRKHLKPNIGIAALSLLMYRRLFPMGAMVSNCISGKRMITNSDEYNLAVRCLC